jgi:hypothetical protein
MAFMVLLDFMAFMPMVLVAAPGLGRTAIGFSRSGLKEWAAGLSLGHLAAACRMYIVQWL